MYNEERKQHYIQEKMKEVVINEYYLNSHFKEAAVFEEELHKDLCDFSTYEISEFYKMLNYTSLSGLTCLNSQFSMYTQWCLQSNLVKDNQNHFLEFSQNSLSNCLNKVIIQQNIINRDTILQMVQELVNPRDQFIMLAIFEIGKSKDFEDIWGAKLSQISESDNTMETATGRIVHISDELIQIAKTANEEEFYYGVTRERQVKRVLIDEGYIVKGYDNFKNPTPYRRGRAIYNSIIRNLKYLGMEHMNVTSIVESGKLYTIKTKAKELGMTSKDFIYSKGIEEIEKQYGCPIVRTTYLLKYGDLL